MRTIILVFAVFVSSCSQRQDYDRAKVSLALINHSYYPISPRQAEDISSDISRIRSVDHNADLVPYKSLKNDRPIERPLQYPVIFSSKNGKIYVAKIFDFSLAYEAGLKAGCEILKVNGKSISELPEGARVIEDLMKAGKSFVCQYSCDSSTPASIQIGQELAYFPFVWSMSLSRDIAYLRVNTFSRLSASYIKNNITNLHKLGKEKLIIDLRGVNGGDYEEAASFLNLFVDKGTVLFETKSDKQGYAKSFSAKNESCFADFKLAVLIDSNTASLGEISAAVLKDRVGAILIGQKTAGKIFITKIFKVGPKNGLRITVARLTLPDRDLKDGINPDITLTDYNSSGDYTFRLPFFTNNDKLLMAAFKHLSGLD